METYLALKYTHLIAIVLSLSLFVLRGAWMMAGSAALQQRWVRIAPHIVDTVLLVSAVTLAVTLGYKPSENPWIIAKLVALVVYIVLGLFALRLGKTRGVRITAFFVALVVFAYLVGVALTKSPMPL